MKTIILIILLAITALPQSSTFWKLAGLLGEGEMNLLISILVLVFFAIFALGTTVENLKRKR